MFDQKTWCLYINIINIVIVVIVNNMCCRFGGSLAFFWLWGRGSLKKLSELSSKTFGGALGKITELLMDGKGGGFFGGFLDVGEPSGMFFKFFGIVPEGNGDVMCARGRARCLCLGSSGLGFFQPLQLLAEPSDLQFVLVWGGGGGGDAQLDRVSHVDEAQGVLARMAKVPKDS